MFTQSQLADFGARVKAERHTRSGKGMTCRKLQHQITLLTHACCEHTANEECCPQLYRFVLGAVNNIKLDTKCMK